MINLIRNELNKISKKKSIYITLLVTLAFVILTNVIYNIDTNTVYYYNLDEQIQFYEEQLKSMEASNIEDKEGYVNYKTELQVFKLVKKYGENSWQSQIIQNQGRQYIITMVHLQYVEPNQNEYAKAKQEYDSFIAKLDSGDWKYFATESLKQTQQSLEEQNIMKQQTNNKQEIAEINAQIDRLEIEKQILNWRLEKDICYGNDYYNQCLYSYQSAKEVIKEYEASDQTNLSDKQKHQNKLNYYDSIERAYISQYDIEHGTHTRDTSSAKGIISNVFSEYEIFIIIMAVMIAGTIVSEEFNKGTIKLLLIKPYKRAKILTAKLITALIMLIIVMLIVVFMQFVVGGIAQGFDTYQEPVAVYNHVNNQIEEISLVKYIAMQAVGKLPIYVLLLTLAFALSTLFTNSALAIAITLLGSMSSSMINVLAQEFSLTWLKFFVTPNWDLTQYFFGGLPQFQGLTLGFSIAIILIYMIVMLVPTYIVFKKKNIKNI